MRQFFRNLQVRQKVFALMSIAIVSLSILNVLSGLWIAKENPIQQHFSNLVPLVYNNPPNIKNAGDWQVYLNTQQSNFTFDGIAIYDINGNLQSANRDVFPTSLKYLSHFHAEQNIEYIPGPKFTLLIQKNNNLDDDYIIKLIIINITVLATGFLLIYIILYFVNRLISRPIHSLTETTNEIAMEQNYSLRAKRFYPDEIGVLAENFNFMLNRIEQDDYMLRQEKEKAEQSRQRAIKLSTEMHEANERLGFEVKVRARVEHKLTDFQYYLNNIIDSMPSAIIAIDHELKITQWNKGASQITAILRDDAIYQPLEESCAFLLPYLNLITNSLEKQITNKVERIAFKRENETLNLDLTIYPLLDTTHSGAVIRIDDVTQRSQMEDMMVQSEKMMSLGGLAAGMAHEINNPLGAIVHTVQNIKRRLNPDNKKNLEIASDLEVQLDDIHNYVDRRGILSFLDNISLAGERASTIVSNMLQFSRQSPKELHLQSLHHIIDRAISIAKNEYNLANGYDFKSIKLNKEFDLSLPEIPCIPSEIEQVILNLLKNAAQALQDFNITQNDGHQITIKTQKNGGFIELSIEDNGPGMSDATLKHIFEPFFTTKEVGLGTGLGLSVSFFIITSHHKGNMRAESQEGRGTRFIISLPIRNSIH